MKRVLSCLVLVLAAACGGHPSQIGLYTPIPRDQVWAEIEQKVAELGYSVVRSDKPGGLLILEKPATTQVPDSKEEIQIKLGADATGVTKLDITSARILPATADQPTRRVAASSRTTSDANAILNLFMRANR